MEAYKQVSEMKGATAGRRQSRTFPLNKRSEAEAFAKKHGGTVTAKGATLYVTWDLPEETELDEANKSDPLVVVRNKRGALETHAKLSTVSKVHGKDYSDHLAKLNKGETVKLDGGRTLSLSTHNEEVDIEEAATPSKDQINKVLGPTKNKEEGLKALMKAFGCDRATAEKYLDSVMEDLDEASCNRNKKEALDPVGKEDDDVDNDGDTDSSDKYLKNRRKKISKAVKDDDKAEISKIESVEKVKESFEDRLTQLFSEIAESIDLSEKKDKHTKDATAPEEIDSKESPKSKEFIAKHKKSDKDIEDAEEKGHDVTFKAGGKDMKQAPNRGNDNLSTGDKAVVNPVKGK